MIDIHVAALVTQLSQRSRGASGRWPEPLGRDRWRTGALALLLIGLLALVG